jgi:DNA-binding CsgD family transcriptional regulator
MAMARRFVADAVDGPAALILEGTAGIGKTAIWGGAVADARAAGVAVRVCRCSESDAGWMFAGLGDLFDGLDPEIVLALPEVQRQALSAALLWSGTGDRTAGQHVVGVAVLGVLRALSGAAPLVLAVDDIQWLDSGSRNVLSFALRRLVDEPVRLIVSHRTGALATADGQPDLGLSGRRVEIGPVSVGVLQRIVREHSGESFSRPTLTRLHQATGGNPLICLEMVRALRRRGHEPAVGEPLPVPADLRVLVTERLHGRTERARQVLLIAGAMARPTVTAVTAASAEPDAIDAVDETVRAGLVELDGERIHFTHPLIASIPYAGLPPELRRRLHRRIAESVSDPEERARHAALGSLERSASIAAVLDIAAASARGRGSVDAAAELAQLALSRTPIGDPSALRRTVDVAEYLFLLGDTTRSRSVLQAGLDAAEPGPARVRGLLLAATIASWETGDATVGHMCAQAMSEAGDDALLRARCHATLAETSPSGATVDLYHAQRAVDLLEPMDDAPAELLSNALTNVALHGCRLGRGLAVEMLERAAVLQSSAAPIPINDRAALGLGMYLKVVDRFDESRTWLHAVQRMAVDEGDDSALPNILGHLATLECWAGRYAPALAYAVEARERASWTRLRAPVATSAHVLVLAHLGRLDEARELGTADLAADEMLGFNSAAALHRRSLGFTELMAGNAASAAEHFQRALSISVGEVGIREPAILRAHSDAVSALVASDRIDQARTVAEQLDLSARANNLPWSTALAGHSRARIMVATGDLAGSFELLGAALSEHRRLPMPFEEARTRMLYASVLRRSGHRSDARRQFEAARDAFIRLGTPIQAAQAGAELVSMGGRTAIADLTPVEERIAGLVGSGQTNREVAAALFVSVRTVESHLGRIYRKLGLRSRTELSRRVSAHPQAETGV